MPTFTRPSGRSRAPRSALSGGAYRPSVIAQIPALIHQLQSYSRISRSHGSSGVVKSKFRSNIPPHAFGASVRVVCCPPCPKFNLPLTRCLPFRRCCTPPTSKCLYSHAFTHFPSIHMFQYDMYARAHVLPIQNSSDATTLQSGALSHVCIRFLGVMELTSGSMPIPANSMGSTTGKT